MTKFQKESDDNSKILNKKKTVNIEACYSQILFKLIQV